MYKVSTECRAFTNTVDKEICVMKEWMDAIVKPAAGPGLELRQVPVPVPGPGEVLIKIHKTALCGTAAQKSLPCAAR